MTDPTQLTLYAWLGRKACDDDAVIEMSPGRLALESITVCCVCGHAIEPRSEREYEACESLGVHLGSCWHALKRMLAEEPAPLQLKEINR